MTFISEEIWTLVTDNRLVETDIICVQTTKVVFDKKHDKKRCALAKRGYDDLSFDTSYAMTCSFSDDVVSRRWYDAYFNECYSMLFKWMAIPFS